MSAIISTYRQPGLVAIHLVFVSLAISIAGCSKQLPTEQARTEAVDVVMDDKTSHQRMLDELKRIEKQTPESNPYLGNRDARELKLEFEAEAEKGNDVEAWFALLKLGQAELRLGREREGIEFLTQASEMLPEIQSEIDIEDVIENYFQLGVGYLRLGESQNCCKRHTPDSCILPIRGDGVHVDKEGSTKAIEYFSRVLRESSTSHQRHKQSRWLVNLAYMTLGEYPNEVPSEYLISRHAFESSTEFPRFINIASKLGLDTFDQSGGAIADDFDGDNYLDILSSSWDSAGQIRLFRNDQQGGFVEMTKQAGLSGITGGLNLVQADYDNDGDIDVLVLRGAWISSAGRHPNSLLRNNGDMTFTDVTFLAGLARVNYPTQTASWGDYDNDGDLDLYVGNESSKFFAAPSQLFRNDGDGTFTDVANEAGVTNDQYAKGVVWGDYNGDRFPDLYVSNLRQRNRLYRNNKDGTFTDVAQSVGVELPIQSFPVWFWDVNNDGNLDIFASSYDGRVEHLTEFYVNQNTTSELACLFLGDGKGGFRDVALEYGLNYPMLPMGSNFGDLNGDGYLDFYLGTGDPDYYSLMPNLMFINRNGKRFDDVSMAGGFAHLQKGHGVAFADLDNDGDVDVFEQMGGAVPGDKYSNSLYENPGFENQWICIKLMGTESNRPAIGARIQVVIEEDGKSRSIYRHVNSGGSFGANPLRQMIGLGKATKISKIEVFWPTTNKTQIFADVGMNQFIQIVEGEDQIETLQLKALQLGGPE